MGIQIKKVITEDFSMKYCAFGNGPKPLIMVPGLSLISTMIHLSWDRSHVPYL